MFSKYEVYTTVHSIYCYNDTNVLKNKLNIKNNDELKQAEEEITAIKQLVLLQQPLKGRFSKTHLLNIHNFLFSDIYYFAGKIRKEQIKKGNTVFYPPNMIDRQLNVLFDEINKENMLKETDKEKQLQNLSYIMSELNIIHPFREGNGRTIREFIRCLGLHYGYNINWGNIDREELIDASVNAVDDNMAFFKVIKKCISI